MKIKDLKAEHPAIYARALECQIEQVNEPDDKELLNRAFDWESTKEKSDFWIEIFNGNFQVFYEKYPQHKQTDPLQEQIIDFVDTELKNNRVFESGSKRDDDSDKPLVNHLDAYMRLRVGYRMRDGANKYDKGNWRKGQPTETALESLNRHLALYEENLNNGVEQDEDHLSAIIFNVQLIMQNEKWSGIEPSRYFNKTK